jgi:hypothetical protein
MMKILIVYSSRTGNTKKIAKAIFDILPEPKELFSVENAPSPDLYDFIAVGFWVNRGTADEKVEEYMKRIKGKKVGVFTTLGAYPNSSHARQVLNWGRKILEGNKILGEFICQGKIDPNILDKMPKDGVHTMTLERKTRIEEAKKHPSETDCRYAQNAFREMLKEFMD